MTTAANDLNAAVESAARARDSRALASAFHELVQWVLNGSPQDEVYSRWLSALPAFAHLDLTLWQRDRSGIDTLALALARIDFYRQLDLSIDERFALLSGVRELLSPQHYLACARVDLERAELLSRGE